MVNKREIRLFYIKILLQHVVFPFSPFWLPQRWEFLGTGVESPVLAFYKYYVSFFLITSSSI